ncbi:MAG: aspartate 1-decarboxylase [Clostridiaceae bacterium]|jgi:aspartate 1-decarboxylase|nr:aspartate 1-decarboxylase [Clostridiaceae bacterium]
MIINMLKSKIHRAVVTEANLNYVGSVTVDKELMEAAGLVQYERVQIVNINNGERFETYCIDGERKSGIICLNGAAARLVSVGDKVIIMAYCQIDSMVADKHFPNVVFVNDCNRVVEISECEEHGQER